MLNSKVKSAGTRLHWNTTMTPALFKTKWMGPEGLPDLIPKNAAVYGISLLPRLPMLNSRREQHLQDDATAAIEQRHQNGDEAPTVPGRCATPADCVRLRKIPTRTRLTTRRLCQTDPQDGRIQSVIKQIEYSAEGCKCQFTAVIKPAFW